jgi:uncharacterized Zn finger protein (UPF0148 family)
MFDHFVQRALRNIFKPHTPRPTNATIAQIEAWEYVQRKAGITQVHCCSCGLPRFEHEITDGACAACSKLRLHGLLR